MRKIIYFEDVMRKILFFFHFVIKTMKSAQNVPWPTASVRGHLLKSKAVIKNFAVLVWSDCLRRAVWFWIRIAITVNCLACLNFTCISVCLSFSTFVITDIWTYYYVYVYLGASGRVSLSTSFWTFKRLISQAIDAAFNFNKAPAQHTSVHCKCRSTP